MPRRPRMYLSGLPYHIVQRGNNRCDCFFDHEDRERYLELLTATRGQYGVAVHAYVLMTNHVHLLVTPEQADSISRMTQVAGSRYAQYVNKKYARTGTLWEGRHKASPVDSEAYLLECYRYIELNPVRANLVALPEEYRWSSYAANAMGARVDILTPHAIYQCQGESSEERCRTYREFVEAALDQRKLDAIRDAVHSSSPLGSDQFRKEIEARLGHSIGQNRSGRPRKREEAG